MSTRDYVCQRARDFGLDPFELLGKTRKSEFVVCRKAIAKELREQGYAIAAIGRALNRHHTSVMYFLGLFDETRYPPRAA